MNKPYRADEQFHPQTHSEVFGAQQDHDPLDWDPFDEQTHPSAEGSEVHPDEFPPPYRDEIPEYPAERALADKEAFDALVSQEEELRAGAQMQRRIFQSALCHAIAHLDLTPSQRRLLSHAVYKTRWPRKLSQPQGTEMHFLPAQWRRELGNGSKPGMAQSTFDLAVKRFVEIGVLIPVLEHNRDGKQVRRRWGQALVYAWNFEKLLDAAYDAGVENTVFDPDNIDPSEMSPVSSAPRALGKRRAPDRWVLEFIEARDAKPWIMIDLLVHVLARHNQSGAARSKKAMAHLAQGRAVTSPEVDLRHQINSGGKLNQAQSILKKSWLVKIREALRRLSGETKATDGYPGKRRIDPRAAVIEKLEVGRGNGAKHVYRVLPDADTETG